MVANAKRLNQIPSWEAYGGRKCHCSMKCVANKVFTTDIARQEHCSMTLCSDDAKSCYNCTLHAIATICMRRVGVPTQICLMMFGTLAKVKHYIRATYEKFDHLVQLYRDSLSGHLPRKWSRTWHLASGQYSYHQYVENYRLWIQSTHRHFGRRIFLCLLHIFVDHDCDVIHS
jgi:hypothetical protein